MKKLTITSIRPQDIGSDKPLSQATRKITEIPGQMMLVPDADKITIKPRIVKNEYTGELFK